ncbi:MAG: Choice-of-anchor protein [Ignavibacteria bacterium]|nr:Choice-of-anchor protein [Ignavibacteria bacterium]
MKTNLTSFIKRLFPIITITAFIFSFTITEAAEKRVLVEEHTGTWCPPCGSNGKPAMLAMINKYKDKIIPVELHYASTGRPDPFDIPETHEVESGLSGFSGFPSGSFDRLYIGTPPSGKFFIVPDAAGSTWDGVISAILTQVPAIVDVQLYYQINPSTKVMTATIIAKFEDNYSGSELRFNVYVMENDLIADQAGVSPSTNYHHKHVCRKMLGGTWGTAGIIPSSVKSGDTYKYTYTYTLGANMNINNVYAIGMVQAYSASDRHVLNSCEGNVGTPGNCEYATSGPTSAVIPTDNTFEKTFTVKNNADKTVTINVNVTTSARTPADWKTQIVMPTTGIDKSGDTPLEAQDIPIKNGKSVDVTVKFTMGETVGIGDAKIVFTEKGNTTAPPEESTVTLLHPDITAFEVTDDDDGGSQSIKADLISTGRKAFFPIDFGLLEANYDQFNNLNYIIWNTGIKGFLTNDESTLLNSLIQQGKNVLLCGSVPLVGLNNTNPNAALFNTLGFKLVSSLSTLKSFDFYGIVGDPLSGNFSAKALALGNGEPYLQDLNITNLTKSSPILKINNAQTGKVVAVRTDFETYRAVYLGFNPKLIKTNTTRIDLINRSFTWLESSAGNSAQIMVDQSSLNFGMVAVGKNATQNITISNSGAKDLIIDDMNFTNDMKNVFSLFEPPTLPLTVQPATEITIKVRFAPGNNMIYQGVQLNIHSNAGNTPNQAIQLAGQGDDTQGVDDPMASNDVLSIKAGPNPFTENMTINCSISGNSPKFADIFLADALGNKVMSIANGSMESGLSSFSIDGTNLSSGIYFVIAAIDGKTLRVPVVHIK